MRQIIPCLSILFLTACFNASNKSPSADKDFKINYVDSIVGDGCTESYTFDTIPTGKNKFVFSSDLMETADINIDGKDVYLKHNTNYVTNDTQYVHVWTSDLWTVEIKTHSVKQTCDECSYNKGTMTIKSGNKIKVIKIHGESGC